jgi:hypothetical protein
MQFLKRLFARRFDPAVAAEQCVQGFKAALGPDLVSVAAFGSWAVGEYVDGHSDLNILVVTQRLDAETLKKLAPAVDAVSSSQCRPLVFSQSELRRFAEAFPLEFQDMAETRKVLTGQDPFQRLEGGSARLAEELESEARNRLIKFRQRWLQTGGLEEPARQLAVSTIGAILPLLRGLLRLKKRKPPRQRVRVIEDACRQFRLSRRTLLQAHDLRYGRKNAGRIDAVGLLDRLLSELERLAEICAKTREEDGGHGGERSERGERGERGDRERRNGGERRRPLGGDKNKRLADVRQAVADAGAKKRWEPKEPERFVSDEMARDTNLSLAARFAWDRAWQSERRAKGYVPVKPPEIEPPAPEPEEGAAPAPAVALSGEEAAAAAWADEVPDPVEAAPEAEAAVPTSEGAELEGEGATEPEGAHGEDGMDEHDEHDEHGEEPHA